MRITQIISQIEVIGHIWQPGITAAMTYRLTSHDIENIRKDDGTIDRDAVERWLDSHSGDFKSIIDFTCTIGDGDFDSGWSNEESEYTFADCFYVGE